MRCLGILFFRFVCGEQVPYVSGLLLRMKSRHEAGGARTRMIDKSKPSICLLDFELGGIGRNLKSIVVGGVDDLGSHGGGWSSSSWSESVFLLILRVCLR